MSTDFYEEFKKVLQTAESRGIIKNLRIGKIEGSDSEFERLFKFETPEDLTVSIIWYWNLYTVKMPGFELWTDDIGIDNCHPSFNGESLRLKYRDFTVATIGHRRNLNW